MKYYLVSFGNAVITTWYIPQREMAQKEKEQYYGNSTTWAKCELRGDNNG